MLDHLLNGESMDNLIIIRNRSDGNGKIILLLYAILLVHRLYGTRFHDSQRRLPTPVDLLSPNLNNAVSTLASMGKLGNEKQTYHRA